MGTNSITTKEKKRPGLCQHHPVEPESPPSSPGSVLAPESPRQADSPSRTWGCICSAPNSIAQDKLFQIGFKFPDCAQLSTRSLWAWHYCFSPTGRSKSQEEWNRGMGRAEGTVPIVQPRERGRQLGATRHSHSTIFTEKVFVVPTLSSHYTR